MSTELATPGSAGQTVAPPARRGWRSLSPLAAVPVAVLLGWGLVPLGLYWLAGPARAPVRAGTAAAPDGKALYARHCASCHGARGDGLGPAAAYVWPRPRDFGEGLYRLKSTATGMPTDDDLVRVLHDGIPGSAMPGFPDLTDDERRALVTRVRDLTRAGLHARLWRKADQDGGIDPADVPEVVDRLTQVGPMIRVPPHFPPATPESLANGRRLYLASCAQCHGTEGRGDGPQVTQLKNSDGTPTRPRDLAAGRFKGGGEHPQLYARILIGMPGTPMPASPQLKPEEVGDVINFVRSLARPDSGAVAATAPVRPGNGMPTGAGGH